MAESWGNQLLMVREIRDSLDRSKATVNSFMYGLHQMLDYMKKLEMMEEDVDGYRTNKLPIIEMLIEGMLETFSNGQTEVDEMERKILKAMEPVDGS